MRSDKIELSPAQTALIEKMAGQGLTTPQMAAILGISKKTFERRAEEDPSVADAIEKGRAVAGQKITAVAFKLASSGKYPPMTMFWLKCRERWREVQVHEHSGPDGKPIETRANLTDEQLDARIKEMLAKKEPKS